MSKNVDETLQKLIAKNKGDYITQGCAFNKNCPRQMELLRFALESSASFSGLVKEMLAQRITPTTSPEKPQQPLREIVERVEQQPTKPKLAVGNYL
ncbi:hypothetical protein ACM26V_16940 [Salipaludibacillus sp. HK11]|uniref:hypothetical protein n=1 Tax=Salipaludibacillus sp. HK11 TaxID=3394320 RepID=UPI0039FD7BAE